MPMLEHPNFVETGPILLQGFELNVGINVIPEFLALTSRCPSIRPRSSPKSCAPASWRSVTARRRRRMRSAFETARRLRLVVIPQAMRVIIPPLTSQYLNLTKNSSLAVAIGYPDLVSMGGTVLNQTGQAVEIIAIWMAVYLTLSCSRRPS
jgi:general L-amino acid transport system permease protein